MIRKTSIFLALPAVFGLLAASPAYAWGWHHGWHHGWGHHGLGVGVALAAPHHVALPVVVAPSPPVVVAPPPVVYARPGVAVVP
ncbi:MAG TPA: hypothetical protein VMB73_12320 [Acetobacteraceae bacterium]|nr:hypothetical protein [Acetobacteraceae bacterium]